MFAPQGGAQDCAILRGRAGVWLARSCKRRYEGRIAIERSATGRERLRVSGARAPEEESCWPGRVRQQGAGTRAATPWLAEERHRQGR